jgi:hypothetical protein
MIIYIVYIHTQTGIHILHLQSKNPKSEMFQNCKRFEHQHDIALENATPELMGQVAIKTLAHCVTFASW